MKCVRNSFYQQASAIRELFSTVHNEMFSLTQELLSTFQQYAILETFLDPNYH